MGRLEEEMKLPLRLLLILSVIFLARAAFCDVAVVKTAGVPAFDEARNGFSSICFENKQEFDLLEDLSNQAQVLESLKAGNFKLILAIGVQAAIFVKENLPGVPLVFCLVYDPERSGLKADHITGVSMSVPVRDQFAVLKDISDKLKRIGVIYTQPINELLITKARKDATDEDLVLVPVAIASSKDIQKAMEELTGKIDALWIPPDPSLVSMEVAKYIGKTSLEKRIPCIGPGDKFVRSGALFSLAVDPLESGKAAADMANKIIQGTSPSRISVQSNLKPKVIINLKAAGLLSLTIPKNVQDAASKIYQ